MAEKSSLIRQFRDACVRMGRETWGSEIPPRGETLDEVERLESELESLLAEGPEFDLTQQAIDLTPQAIEWIARQDTEALAEFFVNIIEKQAARGEDL